MSKKISELTEVIEPSNSDVLPIVNDNTTKKVTLLSLTEFLKTAFNKLYALSEHEHNDTYYTKTEIDTMFEEYEPVTPEYTQLINYLMLYDGSLGEAGENGANVCSETTGGYSTNFSIDTSYWTASGFNFGNDSMGASYSNTSVANLSTFGTKNGIDTSNYVKAGLVSKVTDGSDYYARAGLYNAPQTTLVTDDTILFYNSVPNNQGDLVLNDKTLYIRDLNNNSTVYFAGMTGISKPTTAKITHNIYSAFFVKQDSYQTILDLAGITTTYTDEDTLCADSTAMTTILNNKETVDYMIYNCTGSFMLAFINSDTALTALNNSQYKTAIQANEHWSKFLSMVA